MEDHQCPGLASKLDRVDMLVSSIVTGTWVAFAVLVGHRGPEGIEDGTGGDILGGNKDD